MSKLHEQEWVYRPNTAGRRNGHLAHVEARGLRIVAPPGTGPCEEEPMLRFIAAAPDMARALLEVREAIISGTLSDDAPEVIEMVLRKAGVL